LVTKSLWRLISNNLLWGRVLISKYLAGKTIEEWFRCSRKLVPTSSIGWKAMVDAFPLLGSWATWRIGNGRSVRVGEDPWEGFDNNHRLSEGLLRRLHAQSIFSLKDATNPGMNVTGGTIWKSTIDLNLEEDLAEEWSTYVTSLKQGFILLEEDEPGTIILSKNKKYGNYTIKLGYLAIAEEQVEGVSKWWWKTTWKWKALEKMKILFWLAMEQKLLTWDVLCRRGWVGPNNCALCFVQGETTPHLFFHCSSSVKYGSLLRRRLVFLSFTWERI
jgi:hypothetical protein